MSYISIAALPKSPRQPGKVALIASVVFHGIAFAALPFLSIPTKTVNSQRVVDLIELSGAEQGRLPQFSASQPVQLPNVPSIPPLGLGSLPPFSDLPDYPVDQPGYSAPNPSPGSTFSLNQKLKISPPIFAIPARPLEPAEEATSPEPQPSPAPTPNPYEDYYEKLRGELPNISPSFEPVPLPPTPGVGQNPVLAPVPTGPSQTWLTQARVISSEPELSLQTKEISLPYPPAACTGEYKDPTPVPIAALYDTKGELVAASTEFENPRRLDTTGFPTLNAQALNTAKGFAKVQPTGNYQAFLYDFRFSSETCTTQDKTSPAKTTEKTPTPPAATTPAPSTPSTPEAPTPASPAVTPAPAPTPPTEAPTPAPASPAPTPASPAVTPAPAPTPPTEAPTPAPATETTLPVPGAARIPPARASKSNLPPLPVLSPSP